MRAKENMKVDEVLYVEGSKQFRLLDTGAKLETAPESLWSDFHGWLRSHPLPTGPSSWQALLGPLAAKVPLRPAELDFLPGCCLLDLDFMEESDPQRLQWIRAEYVRAYASIQHWTAQHPGSCTTFVVTGHPGIGKTLFQYYVVARTLHANDLAIIVLDAEETCLVTPFATYKVSVSDITNFTRGYRKWRRENGLLPSMPLVMIDADVSPEGVSPTFTSVNFFANKVFTTSPARQRYKRLEKVKGGMQMILLNPWSPWEMAVLAAMHDIPWSDMEERMVEFGPVPRTCYELFLDPLKLDFYRQIVADCFRTLDDKTLQGLLTDDIDVFADGVSHRVALLTRTTQDLGPVLVYEDIPIIWRNNPGAIVPLSPHIRSELVQTLKRRNSGQSLETLSLDDTALRIRSI